MVRAVLRFLAGPLDRLLPPVREATANASRVRTSANTEEGEGFYRRLLLRRHLVCVNRFLATPDGTALADSWVPGVSTQCVPQ
jgi:hypothetical protein